MEVVRVFNNELSSLYEAKPPISKAKMTQITKSAIKGIKFYKHIVQSVEKFIQKCRPEYKVPGLYVVDSIVRQSRHQFGADKDVFGPRFVKNINNTFQHLFKCNPDDRPKIIRVLNLWQKNAVFPIDVIQPLLDMGHPNSSTDWPNEPQTETKESPHKPYPANDERHKSMDSQNWKGWPRANNEPASETRTYAEMSTKNLEKFMKAEMSNAIEEEASRFRNQAKLEKPEENTVKFNKKLLDFDYGDEDEEDVPKNDDNLQNTPNALALSISQNLLSNPDLLRQLQQLSSIQQQNTTLPQQEPDHNSTDKSDINDNVFSSEVLPSSPLQPPLPTYEAPYMPCLPPSDSDKDDRILPQPPLPPQDLDERSLAAIMAPHRPLPPATMEGYHLPPGITCEAEGDKDDRIIPDSSAPPPPRDLDERSLSAILAPIERGIMPPIPFNETPGMIPYQNNQTFPPQQPLMELDPSYPPTIPSDIHMKRNQADEDERIMYSMPGEPPLPPQDFDERALMVSLDDRSKKDRSRSRSGSRSRGSRSGRHRSRSKSPRRRRSRSHSRSRKSSRSEGRERIHEKERERERDRERRKKGLPPIKKGCVSVCSTTLWLGHVPKSCTESDISAVFGEFGIVLSIDMIPPRGCAFVVMDRRQDANKAVLKLKNLKLQSSLVKMAWAPGKGVKGKEFKEYWDVSAGVSYVPYEKIPDGSEALDLLEEGGFIDEESLPENLKELRSRNESAGNDKNNKMETFSTPPVVPPPVIPPTTVNLPGMVLPPHLMQPQFSLPLPGLLPPQAMVMQVPMGIPPPNPMLMVQQQSQAILNPMGMPPMIPRAVPPVPNALQTFKNPDTSPAGGDATPTEEEGTNVSSPSHNPVSSSVSSSRQTNPVTQFNPILGVQNRPMLPPPVSSAGAPIPYPPPTVSFNFPPPGLRPPTPQFPWLHQKPTLPPFTDVDSNAKAGSRFTDNRSFTNPPNQNATKQDSGDVEKKSDDMEISGNRSSSPTHHDMVISTDDESSLDRDYSRNDPRFQGPIEFPPRLPAPMHHPRGGPPMQGMHFPRGPMGSPFPLRMGGPRGMHPNQRMEMDFSAHPGGPRMPGGHRRDNVEGRDWYPRDYDGPSFERDNRFDRPPRDSWGDSREADNKRQSFDREEKDSFSERRNSRNYRENNRPADEQPDKQKNNNDESKDRNKRKTDKKPSKSLMDDMFKLRFYQRDKNPTYASHLSKKLETKKKETVKPKPEEQTSSPKITETPQKTEDIAKSSGKEKDSRKRSRWGRTLSEEREIQDQKRFEIEIKFQSYEKSSKALQPPSEAIPLCNNDSESKEEPQTVTDCATNNTLTESETPSTDSTMTTEVANKETKEIDTIADAQNTPVNDIPNAIESTAVSTDS